MIIAGIYGEKVHTLERAAPAVGNDLAERTRTAALLHSYFFTCHALDCDLSLFNRTQTLLLRLWLVCDVTQLRLTLALYFLHTKWPELDKYAAIHHAFYIFLTLLNRIPQLECKLPEIESAIELNDTLIFIDLNINIQMYVVIIIERVCGWSS